MDRVAWSVAEADRLWDNAVAVAGEFAPKDAPYIPAEVLDHLGIAYDHEDLDAMKAACHVVRRGAREYMDLVALELGASGVAL